MLSTMQDEQLSLATLLRYGSSVHGDRQISTWTGDGVRAMTFRELGRSAGRLAHALTKLGIGVGDRVATYMWNNNEHVVAYMGVPAIGAVLHPLNIRLFPAQLQYVANHAEDRIVVVDESLVPAFNHHLPHLKTARHVIVNGDAASLEAPAGVQIHTWDDLLAEEPEEFDYPIVDERSAAGMCYTSGTTGDPKGVVYSHRSNWLHAMQLINRDGMGFTGEDTVLAIVPLFHANGWGIPYAAMMNGANVLLPDRFLQPEHLLRLMDFQKPTYGAAVPTIWSGVLAHLEDKDQDISHLRTVVVGGAALSPAMMHTFEEQHGVQLLHAWGMTETSPSGSVAHPPAGAAGDDAWEYRYTQGRFPAAVQARLVGDDGAILPHDGIAIGELEVRGPWITGSYYSPAGNEADPEKFHDGWLRTGDIGRISPDGYLTLVDRTKDVIKSGGEWISSVALENAVMGHPSVIEAAVIGVPDPKWDERPLVAVVTATGAEVTSEELREFLDRQFAKWQLPEHWAFISEVPRTSVGKFDKKRLRAMHADGSLAVETLT